ncbi:MAG TPA: ABC transporter substrate-binding protein [Rhizomicrobium sp.]|jgi:NitT/TauT family transport system substrate-binding protein|nr:ABC transporter substrate-binding protein [Rhizomicrobium sp.]
MIRRRAFLAATASAALVRPAMANTPIRFVTDWKAQAEHGGFYQALAQGLYARRGLDVRIIQGGPEVNVPQLLAGGAADFGMGSNSFISLNMVKAGLPLRAVMAIFQKDPQVLMSHPRRDINSLADMKGKPVLISAASMSAFWPWLRAKFGFSDRQIRKYTYNLAPFILDPNAIQEGYLTSEPFTVEQQAHWKPKVFLLADYGYPGYANMVLVPQSWIDTRRAAVQAFVDATRDGWLHYLDNPAKGNVLIKRDNPDMTAAILAQAWDKMKRYDMILSGDGLAFGLGSMTQKQWKLFTDTMSAEGLYPKGLDYTKAYDLSFVRATLQKFQ